MSHSSQERLSTSLRYNRDQINQGVPAGPNASRPTNAIFFQKSNQALTWPQSSGPAAPFGFRVSVFEGEARVAAYFTSAAALLMTTRPSWVFAWRTTFPLPSSHISVMIVSPGYTTLEMRTDSPPNRD